MKKTRFHAPLAALLLCALLCSCAPQRGDYFAPFAGEFEAELAGEVCAMPFCALLAVGVDDGSGTRPATLTFYAPEALCGTVLSRATDGTLTVTAGGVTVTPAAAEGFQALLSLLPDTGEVTEVTLEDGRTRVTGAGFVLFFDEDGSPVRAENALAWAQVLRFVKK